MKYVKQFIKYSCYIIYSNLIFALIVYFTYTWLLKYSLIFVYIGNAILIVLALMVDNWAYRQLNQIMDSDDDFNKVKNSKLFLFYLESFVSFKTVLYLFYIIILVISEVISYNPNLLSDGLMNFVVANKYSVVLLISIERLMKQVEVDRGKTKMTLKRYYERLKQES